MAKSATFLVMCGIATGCGSPGCVAQPLPGLGIEHRTLSSTQAAHEDARNTRTRTLKLCAAGEHVPQVNACVGESAHACVRAPAARCRARSGERRDETCNIQHTTFHGNPAWPTAWLGQTLGWIGAYDRVIDIHNVRAPSAGKTKPRSVCSCASIKHFDGCGLAATEDAMAHRMQVASHLCASLAARERMCPPPPTALRLLRAT